MRLPFMRRRSTLRPLRRGSMNPVAARVAGIIDHAFSRWPDLPLHEMVASIEGAGPVAVLWAGGGREQRITTVEGVDERLSESSIRNLRRDATRAAMNHIRQGAMRACGVRRDDPDPAWSIAMIEPHIAILAACGIETGHYDDGAIRERMGQALRYMGHESNLERNGFLIEGRITTRRSSDLPQCSISTTPLRMLLHATRLPESTLVAMTGRPLDDVVGLPVRSPHTFIIGAQAGNAGMAVDIALQTRWVPLAPPPAGADMRWLDPLNDAQNEG